MTAAPKRIKYEPYLDILIFLHYYDQVSYGWWSKMHPQNVAESPKNMSQFGPKFGPNHNGTADFLSILEKNKTMLLEHGRGREQSFPALCFKMTQRIVIVSRK